MFYKFLYQSLETKDEEERKQDESEVVLLQRENDDECVAVMGFLCFSLPIP